MPILGARKTTGRSRQLSCEIYYNVVLLNRNSLEVTDTFLNADIARRVRNGKYPKMSLTTSSGSTTQRAHIRRRTKSAR